MARTANYGNRKYMVHWCFVIIVSGIMQRKGKGKGSFYIAQYPVRWTAQSASHFLRTLIESDSSHLTDVGLCRSIIENSVYFYFI